jgi:sugar lactone lactonase YvrE
MRRRSGARIFDGKVGVGLAVLLALAACGSPPKKKVGADGGPDSSGQGGTGGTGGAGSGGSSDGGDAPLDINGEAPEPDPPDIDAASCPALPDAAVLPTVPDEVTFLPNVTVTTIAGSQNSGNMNGSAAEALFADPVSVLLEPAGSLVVCDFDNNALRRVSMPSGTLAVSTLTTQATFQRPFGMALGAGGVLYVNTDFNPAGRKNRLSGTIWRVDTTTGVATVVKANVGRPRGLAALPDGRLVLSDYQNSRVRLLDPTTGDISDFAGVEGCPGMLDATGTQARLDIPYGVAVMADGRVIVADQGNHRLRAITPAGVVTTYAGDGGDGTVDGPRLAARFSHPIGLAVDTAGNIFISDFGAHRIRRLAVDGTVTTVAGDGTDAFKDGTGAEAQFYGVEGLTVAADGKTVYVADGSLGDDKPFHRIRMIAIGP